MSAQPGTLVGVIDTNTRVSQRNNIEQSGAGRLVEHSVMDLAPDRAQRVGENVSTGNRRKVQMFSLLTTRAIGRERTDGGHLIGQR